MTYHVTAECDPEAGVWVAPSDDVPGLATGAETIEALMDKLKVVIPELLRENGQLGSTDRDVPFALRAERIEHTRFAT
jgi:predicted RNase H-like HicB family nuclease